MIVDLGLVDSLPRVIAPLLVSAYGIFLFRQASSPSPTSCSTPAASTAAASSASTSACDAAGAADGGGVLPVAFLANWNAFFAPNVFLHSDDNLTLPVVLNLLLGVYRQKQGVFLAGTRWP